MFSEVKITETYCMANFINGSGGARNWLRNDREMFSVAPYFSSSLVISSWNFGGSCVRV